MSTTLHKQKSLFLLVKKRRSMVELAEKVGRDTKFLKTNKAKSNFFEYTRWSTTPEIVV